MWGVAIGVAVAAAAGVGLAVALAPETYPPASVHGPHLGP
jgi:hypothetical protein